MYDVADLYKTETTIPAAFEAVAKYKLKAESYVREICREKFVEARLLQRIIADVDEILKLKKASDEAAPVGDLWDDQQGAVAGGQSYGEDSPQEDQLPW